jgi:hypothetical protein
LWRGDVPEDDYGGKTILAVDGQPAFAEIAILSEFQHHGWDGVWIDTYKNKFRRGYWGVPPVDQLPDAPRHLLEWIIEARGGLRRGTWDVMCWQETSFVFAESKRTQRDRIRPDQTEFLAAALDLGVPLDSFLVVEWDVEDRGPSG